MSIRTNILVRVYIAFGLILVFAGAVMVQLYRLQFVQGKKWQAKSLSMSTKYENVEATHGNIISVDGSLLATSVPEYELHMDMLAGGIADDKVFYAKVDSLALRLAEIYPEKSATQYSRLLRDARKDGDRYLLVRRTVTYNELAKIKKFPLFNTGRNGSSLIILTQNRRLRPFQSLAARTIGYNNENVKNPVGLEGAYADYINGENGKRLMQRIAGGAYMPVNNGEEEIPAKDGADVITTINVNYQDVAQKALKDQLIKSEADHGCVILMEVATGEIRAIANFTHTKGAGYTPDDFKEKLNYAISDAKDPGSTFKLASYMTLFDQHKIDTNTKVDVEGGRYNLYYKGKVLKMIRDAEDGGGVMTAKRAFEESSNVAVVKFVTGHYADNPKQFTDNLYNLHLNEKLDLQIKGEAKPIVKNPDNRSWSKLTLPEMAYGYEMQLTPLQMLTFYNSVANNGRMIAPVFVREIQRMGNPVEQFQARVINPKVCSDATLGKVKSMLEGVVQEGTGKTFIKSNLYPIAGKTGTAQVANDGLGYGIQKIYQASFCGYFPADHPKYSLIVVINHPTKGNTLAAYVAGPVFKAVADRVYANDLQINQSTVQHFVGNTTMPKVKQGNMAAVKQVYNKLGIKALYASANNNAVDTSNGLAYQDDKYKTGTVPVVTGMGLSDALYKLGNAGYKVSVKGSGIVMAQSVPGGSAMPKGGKVMIELQ